MKPILSIYTKTFSNNEENTKIIEKFLDSINSKSPAFLHFVYDDCSTEPKMQMIAREMQVARKKIAKSNKGVEKLTEEVFSDMLSDCFLIDTPFFYHSDSDYIFSENWAEFLNQIDPTAPICFSLFRREDGNEKLIRQISENLCEIETVIGGSLGFTRNALFRLRPHWKLLQKIFNYPDWDFQLSQFLKELGIPIFAPTKSLVQHIGLTGVNQPFNTTNYVENTDLDILKNIEISCDLGQNARRLYMEAKNPNYTSFLEVGVREGKASEVWLLANKDREISVEGIDFNDFERANLKWNFQKGFSVDILKKWVKEKRTFDFIFVDATHTKPSVLSELYFLWDMLNEGGTIAFHDTVWEKHYEQYAGGKFDTVDKAIFEFFRISDIQHFEDESILLNTFRESNGMTFIKKKKHKDYKEYFSEKYWKEVFETVGRITEWQKDNLVDR